MKIDSVKYTYAILVGVTTEGIRDLLSVGLLALGKAPWLYIEYVKVIGVENAYLGLCRRSHGVHRTLHLITEMFGRRLLGVRLNDGND